MMKWDDKALKTEVREKARRKLIRAAATVERECKKSMLSGSQGRSIIATKESSRQYTRTKKKKTHWSSPPGEPPHVDTGRLRASVTWALSEGNQQGNQIVGPAQAGDQVEAPDRDVARIIAVIGTNVDYAKALEFGFLPRGLKARPYLRPALKRAAAKIRYLFAHE